MTANNQSYWVKSTFYTIFERLTALLFGFGGVMLLLRALSKQEFGIWVLFLTVCSFIEVARNGLVQNGLIKFLNETDEPAYRKAVNTASLALNILLTGISSIMLLAFASALSQLWSAPELQFMFYLYIGTTVALVPFSQANFLQQANFDFKGIFWSNFIRQGLFFAYILLGFVGYFQLTLIGLAAFQIMAAVAGTMAGLFFALPYAQFQKTVDRKLIRRLLSYGKFVFGTNLSTMLYKSVDKVMLGSLLSTGAVAVYELAIKINNLMEVPTASAAAVVFPQSARQIHTGGKNAVKTLYEKSVGAILAVIIPAVILVLLFPEPIIRIIGGTKYLDAIPILRLTVLYTLLVPFARQCGTVFDSIGKPRYSFFITIFGLCVNIVFNYFLVKRFGVPGAAYGTLFTLVSVFALTQYMLYKKLGVLTFNVLKHIGGFYVMAYQKARQMLKPKSPEMSSAKPTDKETTALDNKNTSTV